MFEKRVLIAASTFTVWTQVPVRVSGVLSLCSMHPVRYLRQMKLLGQRILVVGATGGIGSSLARGFAEQGAEVVALGRNRDSLNRLQEISTRIRTHQCDLTAQETWPTTAHLGALHHVVHAAGIVCYEPAGHVTESALRAQLETNLIGPMLLTQRYLPLLQASNGSTLAITSTLGLRGAPLTSAYAATKAAMHAWLKIFAAELAPEVRFNALAPGVIDTEMIRGSNRTTSREELTALHPMNRLGTPEDLLDPALTLLTSPWITGSIWTVDGGLLAVG